MFYYVDHTCRFQHNTGIQRCVRLIARYLIASGIPLRPLVWNPSAQDLAVAPTELLPHLGRWNGPESSAWSDPLVPDHWSDHWLFIVELVSGDFQPKSEQLRASADRLGLKVAWLFHDAIPLRLSHLYGASAQDIASRHATYMEGLAIFDKVFPNSNTTAEHLREFLRGRGVSEFVLASLIKPIPLATEFPGKARPTLANSSRNGMNQCFRWLCVGSLEPRKNHINLLKAVAWLDAHGDFQAELVLVGWANDRRVVELVCHAIHFGLPVQWKSKVDDAELRDWYEWCDATIYPSIEEGFGLPVAESCWHRKPCLCSGEGALGEVANNGGCLTLNTMTWQEIAKGMSKMMDKTDNLLVHLQQQIESLPMRSWSDYVQELVFELSRG